MPHTTHPPDTLARLRRALLVVLTASLLGVGTELVLIEHVEDRWQYLPLVLIALSLAAIGWHVVARSRGSVQALRGVMLCAAVTGPVGAFLHYRGNAEFELEMTPALGGLALFKASMMGATPALAPGTMTLLGALGLLYAWRHPDAG